MTEGKHIAVLLNGPIKNDYRVIKMINSLRLKNQVDLFYIDGSDGDKSIFDYNVQLFSLSKEGTLYSKIIKNTFFYYEFNFLINQILAKKIKYDFIWANDLPTLYPASKIALKLQAKLIYDSHEIYTETINQFFPKKAFFIKKIVYALCIVIMKFFGEMIEKKLVKKTYCMITVNTSLKEYFTQKYAPKRIEIIMNYPYLNTTKQEPVDFRSKYEWDNNDVIFIYQGVLNEGRGLNLLIKSIKEVSEKCKLIILGDGFIKTELINYTKSENLCNRVKFIDKVPLEVLSRYTLGADIGVNLLEPINLSKKLASPNKLFEYIHAGKPVICSNSVENAKIMENYEIGLLTKNTIQDVAQTMIRFANINREKFIMNCKIASEEYTWEKQQAIIESMVN